MVKIAVFDSGMGSLSVIRPIQRTLKCEIIYLADQANFPYGTKSIGQLQKIIKHNIKALKEQFAPDFIIVGSNTPTLLLPHLIRQNIIGITPPLKQAARLSHTKNIAILSTRAVIKSHKLSEFIYKQRLSNKINVHKIDASELVSLVEHGTFLTNPTKCQKKIQKLYKTFLQNNIDVVTLSSTHLPFLKNLFYKEFPHIQFLDPANDVSNMIRKKAKGSSTRNRLEIFTTSNPAKFQQQLARVKIHNKVKPFSLPFDIRD